MLIFCRNTLRILIIALCRLRRVRFSIFWLLHHDLDEKTARSLFYIKRRGMRGITLRNLPTHYLNLWLIEGDYYDFCRYTYSLINDYERRGLLPTCTPYAVMCYTRARFWKYGARNSPMRYQLTAFRYSTEHRSTQEINFEFLWEMQQLLKLIRDSRANDICLTPAMLFNIDWYDRTTPMLRAQYDQKLAEKLNR